MTLAALALVVAATLAVDAMLEHGPERWAAWQRRREAAKMAEAERYLPSRLGVQIERRRDDPRRLPAAPASTGRRRD